MKNKITLALALSVAGLAQAQIGVNTATPRATFDITSKNPTGTTRTPEGLLIPNVDRQRAQSMTGITTSTMIYVNNISTGTATGIAANINAVGYYYYDGSMWVKLLQDIPTQIDQDNNIYNSNGTLTGNRTVSQAANSLAFTNTATTGTNHFSVDGTTFSVDAVNNRVGLGTSTPKNRLDLGSDAPKDVTAVEGKKLAIYNNATGTSFYGFGISDNTLQIHTASTPDGAPLMVLTRAGNVGIGNTEPSQKLTVVDGVDTNQYQGIASFLPKNLTQGVGIGWGGIQSIGTLSNVNLNLNGKGTGNILLATRDNGNVGIGTTNPTTKLDIAGSVKITDGTQGNNKVLTSDANGVATWKDLPATTDTSIYTNNGTLTGNRIVTQGANTLAFTSTAANAFSVDGNTFSVNASTDRVGIGTTTPETKMEIVTNGSGFQHSNGTVKLKTLLETAEGSVGTSTAHPLSFMTNNTKRMHITAAGLVGIGTSTPNSLLDLGSGNGRKLAVWNSAAGDDFYGFGASANVLQIYAGASATENPLMTLNQNGRVGIGTTNPQTNFHTIGTRRFENATAGSVSVGSVLTATDTNGTAEWRKPAVETIVGGIESGAGIDIPFTTNSTMRYTGRYITLPPGRWAVTITQLAQTSGNLDTDDALFVRSSFAEGTMAIGATATPSANVNGGPTLMSFRVQGPATSGNLQQFDVFQGTIFINNNTSAAKTYRYIVGNTVTGGGPNAATFIRSYGGSWSESSIYATAIQ